MDDPSQVESSLEPEQLVVGLAVTLAVGALVGLERERHAISEGKPGFGGVRTFPMVALFGALVAVLSSTLGPSILIGGLGSVAVLLGLARLRTRHTEDERNLGLTTEFAALLVFVLGAAPFVPFAGLAFPQRLLISGGLGTVLMTLLALRAPMHRFAGSLSQEDLLAAARFALLAVVALPLLPDRTYGPYGVLNPFRIGIVVVLIAGISFVGYVSMRLFGARRGIGVTAVAGGLVSSTAVTLTFAAKGRGQPKLAPACALAIALAATIMFPRVAVEIVAIRPALLAHAGVPLAGMLGVGALGCLVLWRRVSAPAVDEEPKGLHNPFVLGQALRLGLAYAVIRFVAAAAYARFGSGGLLLSAAASGLADVDAITISVARMHGEGLATGEAVAAITVAVVTNTLVKAVLAVVLGGRRVGLAVVFVLLPTAAVGAGLALLAY